MATSNLQSLASFMRIRQVDLLAPFLLKAARPIELPAALSPQSMAKHVLVLALKTKITLGPEEIQVFHQLCQSQPPWPRSPPVKAPASTAARTQTRSVRWQQRCQEPARTSWPGAIFFGRRNRNWELTNQHWHFHWRGFGQYTLGLWNEIVGCRHRDSASRNKPTNQQKLGYKGNTKDDTPG